MSVPILGLRGKEQASHTTRFGSLAAHDKAGAEIPRFYDHG
jgi:hypothetical protein